MKNINLYHQEFHPYRTPALVRILQIVCVSLVLCVLGAYFWYNARVDILHTRVQKAEISRAQLSTELAGIQQRLKAQQSDPRLQRQIDILRQKFKMQRPLFDTLEQMNTRKGHSIDLLTALAHQPLPDVWFTHIQLNTNATHVRLEGAGLNPGRISQAFDTLMMQQVFAGQEFAHVQIQRRDDGIYQFTLASRSSVEDEHP